MCHLLQDSSVDNQKLAYFLLQQAAGKRTEHLVLEAAVETQDTDTTTTLLPLELLEMMQMNVGLEGTNIKTGETLSFLLAWMLCFDSFIDAVSNRADSNPSAVLKPILYLLVSKSQIGLR